ncbi:MULTISPECIES: helix-turn-helix domain-containing protein [Nocardia]|uniref:helix-turn-helix domain-containing protein n=1 Tax=Nocardia TaxID=1817 RepID=UPI00237EC997|nr:MULTISPECIES: helix-turn-helix transcriptional regulator [Nocardia]MDE1672746.1 helix-turn-helix transcriptional regulator [Nocardia gipuzkoensis]
MITSRSMGAPAAGGFRHRSRLTASGVPCRHDITPAARAPRASRNGRNIATLSSARHRMCDICGCPSLPAVLCLKFAHHSGFRDRGPKVIDNEMDGVWTTPQFRKLLAEGRPGQALALVRREMGLSQADFGALLHWDRTHAGRVERGEVGTIFDIRELVRAADALGVPRTALLPILLGPVDPRTIEDRGKGADDMDRRQFGLAATITTVAASAPAPSVPPRVGSGHVAYFQTLTQRMWNHDNHFGGGDIAEFALRQYGSARRLLDHGGYGRPTGLRLLAETSRLARCAGWLCLDAGRATVARQCYVESVLMAEQADNDELLANALASLTFLTTDRPTSREPVRLAQRASHLARRIPSARLNAVRSAREAVAYAAIGERQDFEQAMTRAWREVERGLDDVDEPVWLHHVTPFEIRSIEARGRVYLGQHDRAVSIYRETIGERGTQRPRDETSYRAYFAAALAGLGDTTAAITEAHAALTLLEGPVNSPRLLAELRPVRVAATRTRGDDAEHFRLRFDALARTA